MLKIKLRERLAIIIILLISIAVCSYIFSELKTNNENDKEVYKVMKLDLLDDMIESTIDSQEQFSKYIYEELILREEVLKLMYTANHGTESEKNNVREALYQVLAESYQLMINYDFRQLHFHLNSTESFLRFHKPETYGDILADVRETVNIANEKNISVSGFEEGRIYSGYRFVYPLSYKESDIGTVEVSVSPKTIIEQLHKVYPEITTHFYMNRAVVENKVFDGELDNYRESAISDQLLIDNEVYKRTEMYDEENIGNNYKLFLSSLKSELKEIELPNKDFNLVYKFQDKVYLVQFHAVYNVLEEHIGFFVTFEEDSNIVALDDVFRVKLKAYILMFFVIFMFAVLLYNRYVVLDKAKKQAEIYNKEKSSFLANMSHEIRTPINGILGLLKLMEYTSMTNEQKSYILDAKTSSNSLLYLVNDILDISKIEAGKMKVEMIPFNLKALLEEIVITTKQTILEKGLELNVQIDEKIGYEYIGDPGKLRQILINLMSNAIKFTAKGSIEINVVIIEKAVNNRHNIIISIVDSGIGINEETQKRIFSEYIQADDSTTRKYGGTGLGLSICVQLAKMLNGKLSCISEEGEGAKFSIDLDLEYVQLTEPKQVTNQSCNDFEIDEIENALNFKKEVLLKDMKILIAEDDLVNQKVITKLFEINGMPYDLVVNGKEALDYARNNIYDIVFMDCQMPIMDGYEATKEIRKINKKHAIRPYIVALTANAMEGDDIKCFEVGMDSYIVKPVEFEEIIEIVEKIRMKK